MKVVTVASTGLAGLVSAAAGVGPYALAGVGILLLTAVAVSCWIVCDSGRTSNAVALITAARGESVMPPDPKPPGQVPQQEHSSDGDV